jgi:phytoene/squalene synthetase
MVSVGALRRRFSTTAKGSMLDLGNA